jgi:hypothetical protein
VRGDPELRFLIVYIQIRSQRKPVYLVVDLALPNIGLPVWLL